MKEKDVDPKNTEELNQSPQSRTGNLLEENSVASHQIKAGENTIDTDTQSSEAPLEHKPSNPNRNIMATKDELERQKLEKELKPIWRFFQVVALLVPSITLIMGIVSAVHVYQQSQAENFRGLLKDLGAEKAHTRLSAVSRLFTYHEEGPLVIMFSKWPFGGLSQQEKKYQLINSVTVALRIEDNIHVKKEMLRLVVSLGKESIDSLKHVRIDLISELKVENPDKLKGYWENLRETLFQVAIAISKLSSQPPDFRCFPLKGLKIRQQVLDDDANFEGATLSFAEFWGGRIRGAIFRDANLYGAVVRDIDLTGADFHGAELRGATFGPNTEGLVLHSFIGSNWEKVKIFEPPQFRQDLRKQLGPNGGLKGAGKDRNQLCSQILNQDFKVK